MRLNFNVVIVDDLFSDPDDSRVLFKFIADVKQRIEIKGFVPNIETYSDLTSVLGKNLADKKRIDLYISDNNLGNSSTGYNEGIDLYLNLKKEFICDFILYTQADIESIIVKIIKNLEDTKDPNIFSRFTFVSRQDKTVWLDTTFSIINHILTKREEINNLRGLFAQSMSKIHKKLIEVCKLDVEMKFSDAIEKAFESRKITENQKRRVTSLRLLRNGLLHHDEDYCPIKSQQYIPYYSPVYDKNGYYTLKDEKLYESSQGFSNFRSQLKSIENEIMKI